MTVSLQVTIHIIPIQYCEHKGRGVLVCNEVTSKNQKSLLLVLQIFGSPKCEVMEILPDRSCVPYVVLGSMCD